MQIKNPDGIMYIRIVLLKYFFLCYISLFNQSASRIVKHLCSEDDFADAFSSTENVHFD